MTLWFLFPEFYNFCSFYFSITKNININKNRILKMFDKESQKDEIEAISSIYGKDFSLLGENTFDLRICCDDIKWWAVTVSILLPEGYPSEEPPLYEIHTECLAGEYAHTFCFLYFLHLLTRSVYKELTRISVPIKLVIQC